MQMTLKLLLEKLTPKQRKAIPLIAAGSSGKDVANTLNVNPATISQWINHNQAFRKALAAFADDTLTLSQIQLQTLVSSAIDELQNLMLNAKSEQVKLKAIEMVFDRAGINCNGNTNAHCKECNGLPQIHIGAEQYDFFSMIETFSGE